MSVPKIWVVGEPKPNLTSLNQFNRDTFEGFNAYRFFRQWLKSPLVPSNAERMQKVLDEYYAELPPHAFK